MPKHTPGPWKISDDGRTIEAADEKPVTGCVVGRMLKADAALIAAAPEMLAALKATLTALESHLDADANHANLKHRDQLCPCNSNEVQQARAAIQKAEGGK